MKGIMGKLVYCYFWEGFGALLTYGCRRGGQFHGRHLARLVEGGCQRMCLLFRSKVEGSNLHNLRRTNRS